MLRCCLVSRAFPGRTSSLGGMARVARDVCGGCVSLASVFVVVHVVFPCVSAGVWRVLVVFVAAVPRDSRLGLVVQFSAITGFLTHPAAPSVVPWCAVPRTMFSFGSPVFRCWMGVLVALLGLCWLWGALWGGLACCGVGGAARLFPGTCWLG